MTDDDVERLLRRTYREVAARTDEMTSATTMSEPIVPPGAQRRRQPVLAAAAALVLVVAGLVMLTGRGGEAPAAIGEPRHVVPGWIPRASVTENERLFALTEIDSTADVDRLVWSADAGSVTLEYDRLASTLPPGAATTVRGADAVETDGSVAWFGPAGGVATVTIEGDVDPLVLDEITSSLAYVDDATWSELTRFHGFRSGDERPVVHTWSIAVDGDGRTIELSLEGDLHEGLSVHHGGSGWSIGLDRCITILSWDLSDPPDDPGQPARQVGYLIVTPGTPDDAIVGAPDEVNRSVALTSLQPIVDMSAGATVFDNRSLGELPPCEVIDR